MYVTLLLLETVNIGIYVLSIYSSFTGKHEIILHITFCLLSEHKLCKEIIAMKKKSVYEILTIRTFSESQVELLRTFYIHKTQRLRKNI